MYRLLGMLLRGFGMRRRAGAIYCAPDFGVLSGIRNATEEQAQCIAPLLQGAAERVLSWDSECTEGRALYCAPYRYWFRGGFLIGEISRVSGGVVVGFGAGEKFGEVGVV